MWLAIPERIEWQTIDHFTYTTAANAQHNDDIHLRSFLDHVRNRATITIDAIKHRYHVYAHSTEHDNVLHEWSVYQCLYAETQLNNAQYLLNSGKWYNVDKNFRQRIEQSFQAIPRRQHTLPDATSGEAERHYNERVQKIAPRTYALMDRNNIPYPDPRSPIEFCDLYTNQHELIHVKRYGQSSTLSHLFAQGVTSGTLFASDAGFRKAVSKKLPTTHKLKDPVLPLRPRTNTITYAIISTSAHALSIPFFSKVTLNHAMTALQGLGYKVSITKISVT